ncbi:hypothetical protein IC235_15915 [Hymenobacter sp. BT664]|uniref:Uncharacterized protein n=1 Tax=Hymenobacter montanus TaxID=2771359 RepID=A0A927GKD9_9BACT|nr:hypothetical protein [Hymenobacter montanus]MBD2769375.1 hypothetical protein [Hymenobacter montanus]
MNFSDWTEPKFKQIQLTFRNGSYVVPPGCRKEILTHPSGDGRVVEVALFQEHRYAFYYWLNWTRESKQVAPPCLVSLDWHQDLGYPGDIEQEWLDKLDQTDNAAVAGFCWASLPGNNDGQIMAAAYLNLIGNVYVHCRDGNGDDWDDEHFEDKFGNSHIVRKFKTPQQLEAALFASNEQAVYFDIDLDFFTYRNHFSEGGNSFTYMPKAKIVKLLAADAPLIQWIFSRLAGFTIATEPEFCGGISKSNKLLDILNKLYFTPDLFHDECEWKHL